MATEAFWLERMAAHHKEIERVYRPALARGDVSMVVSVLEDWLQDHGIELDLASPDYQTLAYAFLNSVVRAAEVQVPGFPLAQGGAGRE